MAVTASVPADLCGRGKSFFQIAVAQLTFSGSYTAGGDTLNLAGVVPTRKAPVYVVITESQSGYDYVYVPGTDITSGKVKIFQQGAASGAFAELAAGAYPAAITGDTVYALIIYPSNV